MSNTLTIALTRQMAMENKMDVLANNLANASSAGFKSEQLLFVEYLAEPDANGTISLVQDISIIRNYGQGPLRQTNNPLDVAVNGKGWFAVETPQGRFYTRDGSFRLDASGRLVTGNGGLVLNGSGEPIVFTPDETNIEIAKDGTISTSAGRKEGRLGVFAFPDENVLEKVGGNLYSTVETPQRALDTSIAQGMIEQSNVESIIEVTNMIAALRAYQSAQKIIDAELRLQDETIDTLTDTNTG